jgi:outer membrane immunogenic protein
MKKTILAASAAFLLQSTALSFAADLGARPYAKAPAPVAVGYNWSGFYAGVMGGYGWSDRVSINGVGAGTNGDIKGGFGGGTIGYNWQAPGSLWVWGLEVDAAASDVKYSETGLILGFIPYTFEDKIRSFGSVTGRVGVTAGAALFYAKGGYAWADNRLSLNLAGLGFSESKVHSGWTVGAGVEYMFAPSWSLKGEYMYADYGSENYLRSFAPTTGVDLGLTTHTVKGGINYHFNWGGPVIAKY